MVTPCCIEAYAFATADIGFGNTGGDNWNIQYPFTPSTLQSSGSVSEIEWSWVFYSGGSAINGGNGVAAADQNISVGGNGAGVYYLLLTYVLSDAVTFGIYKMVMVDAAGNIQRYATVNGLELLDIDLCAKTVQVEKQIDVDGATITAERWVYGIVDTASNEVVQANGENLSYELGDFKYMNIAFNLELDIAGEWNNDLPPDINSVFAYSNIRTTCDLQQDCSFTISALQAGSNVGVEVNDLTVQPAAFEFVISDDQGNSDVIDSMTPFDNAPTVLPNTGFTLTAGSPISFELNLGLYTGEFTVSLTIATALGCVHNDSTTITIS